MDLWPRAMDRVMRDYFRDFDRFERSLFPYWRNADHSVLHVANDTHQLVNDENKFAVGLDVSQFRPEDLKVHLDGRELTIEGRHQHKDDKSFMERSFVRKWTLPENVDLEAVRTQLNDSGHLSIEAPKIGQSGSQKRSIPIERIPSQL
ncbi:Hsp20/alpha crystallin family protein [Dictyocaulus viviparus]|uniref:Hsp20/alpha crystallin family protein n=1 Tax=Dictyocaulus viviparus TaxID=29172 RepID=A0A0D8XX09_DICVI|nr:Hsp20/alpha crystallin family protein [Dictyocaulus viviparus]